MRILVLVLAASALSGCALFPWLNAERPGGPREAGLAGSAETSGRQEDWMAQQLAAAAGRAEAALGRLSRIESTRDPIVWREEPEVVPEELLHEVSLDWTGPVAEVTERLAGLSGFRFQEVGVRPVQAVIVDVHVVERSVIAVLREVGYQAGTRAKVVVDARRNVVELVNR